MRERNTQPLFLEDIYDALQALVWRLGGAKTVGGRMWPHKPAEQSRQQLLDCLNRDNARKLDLDELLALLRLAKEAGYHDTKHWLDGELGYEPSAPSDPAIQRDRLADEMARAAENFDRLHQAVARMNDVALPASLLKRA